MSKASEAVKKWRKDTKKRIVDSMGGKCQCCGYSACLDSLDLHHIDPSKKELSFGAIRSSPVAWPKIVEELKKCVLVCRNCHGEIHAKTRILPENAASFDESFTEYRNHEPILSPCKKCGKPKPILRTYCCLSCARKDKELVDWDSLNLEELIKQKNISAIADDLNVSWHAVRKQLVKRGLLEPYSKKAKS